MFEEDSFGEERKKLLTLLCEGIPDIEGYEHNPLEKFETKTFKGKRK